MSERRSISNQHLILCVLTPRRCSLVPPPPNMRPAQDRGGGREGKKSLRVGKRAVVEAAKKFETEQKNARAATRPVHSLPAPRLMPLETGRGAPKLRALDGAFHAMNRNFEHDSQAIIDRARDAGVAASVVIVNDFGKMKDALLLTAQWPGVLYLAVGLHPDNIKRVHNMSQFAEQMEAVHDHALAKEAVRLFTLRIGGAALH